MNRQLSYGALCVVLLLQGSIVAVKAPQEPQVEGKPLAAWIEQTQSPDRDARRKAALAIGRIAEKAKAAVPALIVALSDSEAIVRDARLTRWAKLALMPGPPCRLLSNLSRTRKRRFGEWAAFALGRIAQGEAQAVPALARLLADPAEQVQMAAATALGRFNEKGAAAVPALIAALADRSQYVRRDSILALGFIGQPAVQPLTAALKDKQHTNQEQFERWERWVREPKKGFRHY